MYKKHSKRKLQFLVLDTYSTRFQDIIAQLLKTTQQALCYLEGKQILTFQWMLVFFATT